jgi:pantetheine-phosphate adenylyltransferase
MKSIGIYSGCFDPIHKGHEWIINEGSKIFDELHVMIGPNPSKKQTFSDKEKLTMLNSCTLRTNVQTGILPDQGIIKLALDLGKQDHVFLLRGIRNSKDFFYEDSICQAVRKLVPYLQTVFLTPPDDLASISSTLIKDVWQVQGADAVENLLPPYVYDFIKHKFKGMVFNNSPSIFETTTAGFAPAPSEAFEEWMYPVSKDPLVKMRSHFDAMVNEGFIGFADKVTAHQISLMMDPVPINVISSETFHLHCIPINDQVTPTGDRYLPSSRSLGPIIIDKKTEDLADIDAYGRLGEAVIIEGKHRWLDAKENGQPDIWAWIGDMALPILGLDDSLER